MRVLIIWFLLLIVASGLVATTVVRESAAQQRQTTLYLECPGEDRVGHALCFHVREQIRKSAVFGLALDPTTAFARVRIHTVDRDTPPTGQASAVGVILTLAQGDSYLHHQILFVGRNKAETAAVSIVAGIDEYLDQLFKDAGRALKEREKQ